MCFCHLRSKWVCVQVCAYSCAVNHCSIPETQLKIQSKKIRNPLSNNKCSTLAIESSSWNVKKNLWGWVLNLETGTKLLVCYGLNQNIGNITKTNSWYICKHKITLSGISSRSIISVTCVKINPALYFEKTH